MTPLPQALILALAFCFSLPLAQISGTLQAQAVHADSTLAAAHRLFAAANLLANRGHHAQAEPKLLRVLSMREKALGLDHPDVALTLHNLGFIYNAQDRYAEAEPLLRRALAIRETVLGPQHLEVALTLNSLAFTYGVQSRYDEAEPLYARALAIRESALGPAHPDVAFAMNNLAFFYTMQSR